MIRNCFVREENDGLILCSGIPRSWLDKGQPISFGTAPTSFGDVRIAINVQEGAIRVEWIGQWLNKEPLIEVRLPGYKPVSVPPGVNSVVLKYEAEQ